MTNYFLILKVLLTQLAVHYCIEPASVARQMTCSRTSVWCTSKWRRKNRREQLPPQDPSLVDRKNVCRLGWAHLGRISYLPFEGLWRRNWILSYLQKRLPVRTNVKMRILIPDFHTFLSLALLGKICLSFKKKLAGYRIVSLVTIIHMWKAVGREWEYSTPIRAG